METTKQCPHCHSSHLVRNGHVPKSGKQIWMCRTCSRQFVEGSRRRFVSEEKKELVKNLLLERLSLRAISRVAKISMPWLTRFSRSLYEQQGKELAVPVKKKPMPSV